MPAIEFKHASFTYDGNTPAFADVSVQVREGEFLCVLGGNGSGKSTFAKHINALLVPDEGTVRVLDNDSSDPANTYFIRSNAGMVFQNPDDQIVASVVENDVAFGPENLGVPSDELRHRVTDALAQVGLQGYETKETANLSGGQKQRVAVAGVLAMQPSILVLDEASAMLDPRGRSGLMRVCRELHDSGMTIVLITHFMEEAALADRIVVLDGGHVALEGTPDEVLVQSEVLDRLSLEVPFAVRISRALQERGVPVGLHVDMAPLERELAQLLTADPRAAEPIAAGADDPTSAAPSEPTARTAGADDPTSAAPSEPIAADADDPASAAPTRPTARTAGTGNSNAAAPSEPIAADADGPASAASTKPTAGTGDPTSAAPSEPTARTAGTGNSSVAAPAGAATSPEAAQSTAGIDDETTEEAR